jgi:hypothetical protein
MIPFLSRVPRYAETVLVCSSAMQRDYLELQPELSMFFFVYVKMELFIHLFSRKCSHFHLVVVLLSHATVTVDRPTDSQFVDYSCSVVSVVMEERFFESSCH